MEILAVRDMVIVEVEYSDKVGSIVIPDKAKQYSGEYIGKVIAVGPDYKYDLCMGDRIIFWRHEGYQFTVEARMYRALKEMWVAARIEN